VIGLIVPSVTGVLPILTPMGAIGLGVIMVLAARIHLGLGEPATAVGNLVLLAMCLFVAGAGGRDECARRHRVAGILLSQPAAGATTGRLASTRREDISQESHPLLKWCRRRKSHSRQAR
jgi:hypothetical protein